MHGKRGHVGTRSADIVYMDHAATTPVAPEVVEAMLLFGEYDLYAKLVCDDFGMLGSVVITQIRAIEGVDSTKTLTAAPIN